jgi:hypothetical protein
MATDDDPPSDPKEVREPREPREPREAREPRESGEKLNERLTEKIRQGTNPPDDKLNDTIRQRLEHLVPELVKKTFAAGMGAVFSTEEGIRKIAREVSLPDVVGYVATSADGAKDKVFEIVARETREFLSNLNLTDEIAKILTTLSFEIKTEIRFIPNSERLSGAEPDVKASVRLKRNDKYVGGDDKEKDREKEKEKDREPRDAGDKPDSGDPRDSRSRLRFWRRDGENTVVDGGDDEDEGHDR